MTERDRSDSAGRLVELVATRRQDRIQLHEHGRALEGPRPHTRMYCVRDELQEGLVRATHEIETWVVEHPAIGPVAIHLAMLLDVFVRRPIARIGAGEFVEGVQV